MLNQIPFHEQNKMCMESPLPTYRTTQHLYKRDHGHNMQLRNEQPSMKQHTDPCIDSKTRVVGASVASVLFPKELSSNAPHYEHTVRQLRKKKKTALNIKHKALAQLTTSKQSCLCKLQCRRLPANNWHPFFFISA